MSNKTNEKIDQLAEKIKFDVDRLASYKRLDRVLPAEPKGPFALITCEKQVGTRVVDSLIRDANTGWWYRVVQGNAGKGRSWSDHLDGILNRGDKVVEVKVGDWTEVHDLTSKEG